MPKQFSPTMSPTLSSITQVCVAAFPTCLSPFPFFFPAKFFPSHPPFLKNHFSLLPILLVSSISFNSSILYLPHLF